MRLRLCEVSLDRLARGEDPNDLAIELFQAGDLPLQVVGAVVGELWRGICGVEDGTVAISGDAGRAALAQLGAAADPSDVAQLLCDRHGLHPDAAAWSVERIHQALCGSFDEEEFSILDFSPGVRIGAGVFGLVFFTALTIWSFTVSEPGATVLVGVGALAGSGFLVVHGLKGLFSGD